ncbi:MAG: VCBS repeat-containing protein, partial [Planctomycetota bacterium]
DVMSASWRDDIVAWYENDGAASPTFEEHVITTKHDNPHHVASADLDGDEDLDVLVASLRDNTVAWYENDGAAPPTFPRNDISVTTQRAEWATSADLDGDQDLDVLSASREDDTVAWYENDGAASPTFTKHVITDEALAARSVASADLDGDDDLDVLSISVFDNMVAWYENDGATSPTFTTQQVISNFGSYRSAVSVASADLDGDQDVDVLSAYLNDDTVAWYENDGAASPRFTMRIITTTAHTASFV